MSALLTKKMSLFGFQMDSGGRTGDAGSRDPRPRILTADKGIYRIPAVSDMLPPGFHMADGRIFQACL